MESRNQIKNIVHVSNNNFNGVEKVFYGVIVLEVPSSKKHVLIGSTEPSKTGLAVLE